ncbi:MAG: PilT/PilU family type 4a pilus ATPase [Nitrospirota bacterium]|nr:PilT/PilU family type 4a pilus ATPase [Nitrospirota bacterium]
MELLELLREVRQQQASDLHLVAGSVPRLRVDGRLKPMPQAAMLTSRNVSDLAESLLTKEHQRELAESGEWDGAYTLQEAGRFRFHLYTQRGSLAMAVRAVSESIPSIDELGLPSAARGLMQKSQGLVLVTGPTGSGKSTTLAAMLDQVNQERRAHIVSLEDPIEILHPHKKSLVSQLEVGSDVREFQAALKGILRQDPDVVFLGELRDRETIQAALTMAETGHLTVATLHTNSSIQSLTRLISVFPAHQQQEVRIQLSMVLEGILSQRLLPCVKGPGRALALEILILSPAIRNLIREDKLHQIYSMMQTGQSQYGMQTMNQSLAKLCRQEVIGSELALELTMFPEELTKLLERTRHV